MIRVRPDGTVETFCGTKDLGTGTRTITAQIVADTFGLPLEAVKINIGSSKYPISGPSGGSTTVGGVSESHRRASEDALAKLLALAAPKLGVEPGDLEVREGSVRAKSSGKSMTWKEVCKLLELKPLEVTAEYVGGTPSKLSSSRVGGVQMAHVAVDRETGVIKMKKFVAVQDIGLVMNPRLAESQINGAVCMGIAYSLFERRLLDPKTGAFINAELADYKLARIGDVGEVVVKFYEPESERSRGVVGIGEPPVISPGAAISNAVCNALGVRVPVLPLTPERVLKALEKAKA
jgi:xanthine dehydrogenase YagR molybdenum-binding subunit